MLATKSSGASLDSRARAVFPTLLATLLLAALSAAAVAWFHSRGYLLYYGDAEAHLNIARRIVDSRNPGYEQIGTFWLPLPHWLMLPLIGNDAYWRSGLAGALPSALCFVLAGAFLFAATRRIFGTSAAGFATLGAFALNPNLLYLQSTPMTEPVFFAALCALLYFSTRFRETQSAGAVAGAGLAAVAATLTRYEGWFLLPFAALYFLFAAQRRRLGFALLFSVIASIGPLYWFAHNQWCCGSPLEFFNGAGSTRAIYQRALDAGMQRYLGDGNWANAWLSFRAAAWLCAGTPLVWLGAAGVVAALWKRSFWPVILLALPPVFYVWSNHSAGATIFVPHLWPNSYYNTRYGLAALPLLAFAAGALAAIAPPRFRSATALAVVAISIVPWIASPQPDSWICWKESQINSVARRAWTREAADFLRREYRPGSGIITSFGDLTGIVREAGLRLDETLHQGNSPHWLASVTRPDLFLWEEWAVVISGDTVATALVRASRAGPIYRCVKMIAIRGEPVIEIYRRDAAKRN